MVKLDVLSFVPFSSMITPTTIPYRHVWCLANVEASTRLSHCRVRYRKA